VSEKCHEYEVAITAAGADDLEAHVEEHLEACASCARLREQALALSGMGDVPGDAAASLAVARRAVAQVRRRRPLLWAVPLLSASASAAALILYFGIYHAPASGVDASPAFAATLPESQEISLPESLRAVSDLLLAGNTKENGQ
jgi:hypothetical protein